MNVSVRARIAELGYDVDLLDEKIQEVFVESVARLAKEAQDEWVRLAQARLNTSRDIYINGLRSAESFKVTKSDEKTTFEVSLVGKVPNQIEFGMPSFDMKAVRPGWLGGTKARRAKDGSSYVIIPFRHSTTSNTRLGYTGKAKAADMKTKLKKAVKEYGLDKMVRAASGQVTEGPVKRISNKAPVHPYLKGLTRYQTAQSGTTPKGLQRGSSQLMTFRVMSENSDPGSWIHPGLKPANILEDVQHTVEQRLDEIIHDLLGGGSL